MALDTISTGTLTNAEITHSEMKTTLTRLRWNRAGKRERFTQRATAQTLLGLLVKMIKERCRHLLWDRTITNVEQVQVQIVPNQPSWMSLMESI